MATTANAESAHVTGGGRRVNMRRFLRISSRNPRVKSNLPLFFVCSNLFVLLEAKKPSSSFRIGGNYEVRVQLWIFGTFLISFFFRNTCARPACTWRKPRMVPPSEGRPDSLPNSSHFRRCLLGSSQRQAQFFCVTPRFPSPCKLKCSRSGKRARRLFSLRLHSKCLFPRFIVHY